MPGPGIARCRLQHLVSCRAHYSHFLIDVPFSQFESPKFGLGRKECENLTAYATKVAAFRKYMHRVASLFAGPDADSKMVQTRVDEIFELDCKLALVSLEPKLS